MASGVTPAARARAQAILDDSELRQAVIHLTRARRYSVFDQRVVVRFSRQSEPWNHKEHEDHKGCLFPEVRNCFVCFVLFVVRPAPLHRSEKCSSVHRARSGPPRHHPSRERSRSNRPSAAENICKSSLDPRLVSVADVVHSSPQEETLMDDGLSRFREAADCVERGAAGASALLTDAPTRGGRVLAASTWAGRHAGGGGDAGRVHDD